MEERIVKLEGLLALQDRAIEEQGKEIFRQQQDFARLRRRLDELEEKLENLQDPEEIAGSERPPHY